MTRLTQFLNRQSKLAIAAVLLPLYWLAYSLPNQLTVDAARTLPLTAVDRAIPFVPEMIWVYLTVYFFLIAAFLLPRPGSRNSEAVYAFVTMTLVAAFVHALFPTAIERDLFPLGPDVDAASRASFELLRSMDTPASCLPSLHVASATLAALLHLHGSRSRSAVMSLWAVAIAVSTLFTKQHYLVDVVAGAVLAIGAYLMFCEQPALRSTAAQLAPVLTRAQRALRSSGRRLTHRPF